VDTRAQASFPHKFLDLGIEVSLATFLLFTGSNPVRSIMKLDNVFRTILYVLVGIMVCGVIIVMLPWVLIVCFLER